MDQESAQYFVHLVDQREDRAVLPHHEDLDENDLDGAQPVIWGTNKGTRTLMQVPLFQEVAGAGFEPTTSGL